MIEEKVDKEAIDLTSQSIAKADRILKLRQENKEEIRRRAMAYVERYKGEMTSDLYEETKRQVEKAKIGEEPKKELRKETKTTKPTNETERKTIAKKRPTAVQADSEIRTEQPRVRRRRPTVTE